MKQKNMYCRSFGLVLSMLPVFSYGDIGSDANITQFNTQQIVALDGQRVATLAALSGGLAVNNGVTGTWDSFFPLSGPLALNGGTLSLNRDLLCRDVSSFQSLGSIFGNSHSVGIAHSMDVIPKIASARQVDFSDVSLQLDGDVALNGALINFTGNCNINGGGNSLSFDNATTFVIASGATLYLDNMLVKHIGASNFVFKDASSSLKLSNITFQLADNITQKVGNVLVDGPMTLITRNFNWHIHGAALMKVNGVTLWTDPVGGFPAGALTFGAADNLSLVSSGVIKAASSVLVDSSGNPIDFAGFGKRDPLDDALSTSTGFLQSQIDLLNLCCSSLKTSTGSLQSEIDVVTSEFFTSTGFLQSEIDACCAALKTSTGLLQSEIDAIRGLLFTTTGFLQSEIDVCCAALKTSTGFLQSQVDVHTVVLNQLKTSTGFLQSEIDACCAALKTSTGLLQSEIDVIRGLLFTSTGFLQSEIDVCCAALKTSTGFLQSQVDVHTVVLNQLKTSTGFLQSEIDILRSVLRTSTGFLQSEIDACCAALKTSTGFMQSEIDAIRGLLFTTTGLLQSEIDVCCAALKTSTGFLQSQVDVHTVVLNQLKTSTGFLQSEIDILRSVLRTSTGFLQSEIDACCAALKTSTGFMQSEIDAIRGLLFTTTGLLQSEIDVCCAALRTSTGFLQSQVDVHTVVLNQLKTSTGFLQLEIDACCAVLKTSTGFMQSEIDIIRSSLFTSTGFLQSEIDACCAALKTSTGFLQSEIDSICTLTCITRFISRLDNLETCCAQLQTSTGFLQSQIDVIINIGEGDCCNVSFLTSKAWLSPNPTHFSDNVVTADWSFDSKYLAIGLSNFDTLLPGTPAIQIYQLNCSTLSLVATFSFDCTRDISEIRWHPSEYRLAVGRGDAKIATPCVTQLHIFDFNPVVPSLTNTSNGEANHTVYAVSWRPMPLDASHDILAVGREVNGAEVAIYTVDNTGVLSVTPVVTATTAGQVQFKALDWDASSTYLAAGVGQAQTLQIFAFNPVGPTLTLATSTAVGGHTVLSVDWNDNALSSDLLAVGLSSFPNPADPLVQVYRFTGPNTLTNLCGISGLTDDIPAVDWHPNGKCLAITQDFDLTFGSQFITYAFNKAACIFTQDSFYQFGDINLEEVRWAPNGRYVAVANDFCDSTAMGTVCPSGSIPGAVTVYDNDCLTLSQLAAIIKGVECCCTALQTSTGFLQSEIDSCCVALQTSTGFLQSQIDMCCSNITPTTDCIIIITVDTFYDPVADPRMLLLPGQAVVFQFSPCVGANEIPKLIFNSAVYDPLNINNGQVVLPADSQLIFQGTGFVELQGVGGFNLQGVDINDNTTPPNIVIQDKATMHLCSPSINPNICANGATWTVQGIGRFIIREDGLLLLDNISQMIFGAATTDAINVQVEAASAIILDVPTTTNINGASNAFVTFQLGTFNIEFSDFSALDIRRGIFELNTNKGVAARGDIQTFNFVDSSSINIQRNAEVPPSTQATWLALAPNLLNAAIGFNNQTGVIYGNGDIRFRSLDAAAPIDTVLLLQNNFIALDDTMVELFLNLSIRLGPNTAQIAPSDLNILVQMGAASTLGTFRQLAAIKQIRNGSVQLLQEGDHDVAYQTTGTFITGFDQNSRYFKINSSGNRVTY